MVEFRQYIRDLLKTTGLAGVYIDLLTDDKSMKIYQQAFTHPSIDSVVNYEWLEIMGDATLNKAIVWYVSRRFPILQNPEGVKVIARLKINMVSKKKFAEIAESLGMDRFIRVDPEQVQPQNTTMIRSIMEDVLEAFFGATEWILDDRVEPGAGYGICYLLLKHILDPMDISLEYNDLYDAITRLKETMDVHRNRWPGNLRYKPIRDPIYAQDGLQRVQVVYQGPGAVGELLLGDAQGRSLDDAKQAAAQKAIVYLDRRDIRKNIPAYYLRIREWLRGSKL
jgi:dsRNA-specific ribonuclease